MFIPRTFTSTAKCDEVTRKVEKQKNPQNNLKKKKYKKTVQN